MAHTPLPLIVEPAELETHLGMENLLIADLCRPEIYAQAHLPGAVHLDYAQIVAAQPPSLGLLPNAARLSDTLGSIGMRPESHVVAYDDEGGGRAARLLWTLDVIGHARYSLLNGGLHAWLNERRRVSAEPVKPARSDYPVRLGNEAVADKNYVMNRLHDPDVVIVDTRTPAEYRGETRRAERTGHIPGAVNFDWMNAIDQAHSLRLKPADELIRVLTGLGVTPDKEIITYCQTHHRSAHTYMVLKRLGYPRVRGYPGSWSEWGNSPETPIE
ncbi:thiosulfate sulfurtransferase [Sulfuricaulis limicola]|uniref:Sulfurtransferase n=1 Tax=Sulfuricaulis limicola TaxID=1620215 RepID=A0A1B4XEZ6_9GAMM|nr:sulfurtransferase [Sulfuricaulis limicola]BAV33377.1 thiosulfate sulfurtransferase [Sulfuricaulis limicola]